jgi:arylsulfatase A-like enzyme
VLVSIDTLRADHLPAYGYRGVETPAIDALRRDGILFENAYAHVPLTLPSHASLLSGLLPPESGVRDNLGYRLAATHRTIAKELQERGYATGAFVTAYVLRRETGLAEGFAAYSDVQDPGAGGVAASALRRPGRDALGEAVRWLGTVRGGPFFLFLHLYEPHAPPASEEPFRSRYPPYDAAIATADALVSDLVQALKQADAYDDSLLVLLSDHGEGLSDHGEREHGLLLYREALHVPLVLKLPGGTGAGRSVARAVGLVDVLPTVADVLHLPRNPGLPGASLLDETPPRRGGVYGETYYPEIHLGWSGLRSAISERAHLVSGARQELFRLAEDPREERSVSSAAEGRELEAVLAKEPPELEAPRADAESAEALRSLGYLAGPGGGREPGASRPDPRDHVGDYEALEDALTAARRGDAARAADQLTVVLKREPGLFDAEWELGAVLTRLGRYAEADGAFQKAAALAPSLGPVVGLSAAEVELALGRLDAAQAHARVALEVDPARAHGVLAKAALARGDLKEAESEANRVAGGPRARSEKALVLAQVNGLRGQFRESLATLDVLRASLEGRPLQNLEFLRGEALDSLGRPEEAERAFRAEIEAFPRNLEAYGRLAGLLRRARRSREEVQQVVDAMCTANPGREAASAAALIPGARPCAPQGR